MPSSSDHKELVLKHPHPNLFGFTLLELLIVISIIALLAVVIFFLLSPAEQLAKARDASRIDQISQISKAVESFYLATQTYPTEGNNWMDPLLDAGELGAIPAEVPFSSLPSGLSMDPGLEQSNLYYDASGASGNQPPFVIYSPLESRTYQSQAPSGSYAFQVYSSQNGSSSLSYLTSSPGSDGTPTSPGPSTPTTTPPVATSTPPPASTPTDTPPTPTNTPPASTPPTPSFISADASTCGSVNVTWGASAGAGNYVLQRCQNAVATNCLSSDWIIIYQGLNTNFSDITYTPGSPYTWRVRACVSGQTNCSGTVRSSTITPSC